MKEREGGGKRGRVGGREEEKGKGGRGRVGKKDRGGVEEKEE